MPAAGRDMRLPLQLFDERRLHATHVIDVVMSAASKAA
jgi:hypothetical protein